MIMLLKKIHTYNMTYKNNVKYKEFIVFIHGILTFLENVFRSVYTYCTQGNDIFEENLYKGSIKYAI